MVERQVFPQRLLKLYDEILWIRKNYPLSVPEKNQLNKVRGLLWKLHAEGREPVDPDEADPLFAKANQPDEADRAACRDAVRLLRNDASTYDLGTRLWALEPDMQDGRVQGWRWKRAAEQILDAKYSDKRTWLYFTAMAVSYREADRERPLAKGRAPVADNAYDGLSFTGTEF